MCLSIALGARELRKINQHSTHSGNSGTGHAHFLAIPLTGKITIIALFTMMQLFNCLKTLFLQYNWKEGILFDVGLKFVRTLLHPEHAPPLGCALFYKPIWQLTVTVNERGHYADSEDTFLFKIEDSPDTRLGA